MSSETTLRHEAVAEPGVYQVKQVEARHLKTHVQAHYSPTHREFMMRQFSTAEPKLDLAEEGVDVKHFSNFGIPQSRRYR